MDYLTIHRLVTKHQDAPEVAMLLDKIANDVRKKLGLSYSDHSKSDLIALVAEAIADEMQVLEQEGLM